MSDEEHKLLNDLGVVVNYLQLAAYELDALGLHDMAERARDMMAQARTLAEDARRIFHERKSGG